MARIRPRAAGGKVAFWAIAEVRDAGQGLEPNLNFGGAWDRTIVRSDLVTAKEGQLGHVHLIVANIARPHTDFHWHEYIRLKGGGLTKVFHGPAEVADHEHPGNLQADYFLCFIMTTPAGRTAIRDNNDVEQLARATMSEDGDGRSVAGPINTAEWSASRRNTVNGQLAKIGLVAPANVITDQNLIDWLLPFGTGRNRGQERIFRFARE